MQTDRQSPRSGALARGFPHGLARFVVSQISGAEIHCIVQEAGMQAVRNNRYVVLPADFEKGYKANTVKNDKDFEFYK